MITNTRTFLAPVALVALLAACDSSNNDAAGGNGGGPGTASGPTGGPTSASTGTPTSSGASPTTVSSNVSTVAASVSDSSSIGNHPECMHAPYESMEWTIALPGGAVLFPDDLDAETNLALPLEGEVVSVSATGFVVDTCPPNADCLPSLADFDFETRDANGAVVGPTELGVALGAFVSISGHTNVVDDVAGYPQNPTPKRTFHLEVHNLETWGGETNPIESGDALLLIVSSLGLPGATLPAGIAITHERTCAPAFPPSMEVNTALTVAIGNDTTVLEAGDRGPIAGGPPNLEGWHVASNLSDASGVFPPQFFLWRNDTP